MISPAGSQSWPSVSCRRNEHALDQQVFAHAAAAGQRQHLLVVDDDWRCRASTCAAGGASRPAWRCRCLRASASAPPRTAAPSARSRRSSRTGSRPAPRRWKPHRGRAPARQQASARDAQRSDERAQTTTLTSRPGTTTTFFDRRAVGVLRHFGARARRAPRSRRWSAAAGTDQLAAQLAVDLQHQLDLVLRQRRGVDLRPRRVEQVAVLARVAEVAPQRPRRCAARPDRARAAGCDRPSRSDAPRARGVGGSASSAFSIFIAGRHDGVVLDALVVVVRPASARGGSRAARPAARGAASRQATSPAPRERLACACANAHSRFRKRCAPSTPASDHIAASLRAARRTSRTGARCRRRSGRSCPAGRRRCASIFDILPTPPYSTGVPSAFSRAPAMRPSASRVDVDVVRREVVDAALVAAARSRCG